MSGFENVKHGDYILELKPGHSIYNTSGPPQIAIMGDPDLSGANFSMGYSYLTRPFLMVGDSHRHEFDQIILFLGCSADNITDFDAEIEFTMGDTMHSITFPACVRIPGGTLHGPLSFKRITRPLMFFDITLSASGSIRPFPTQVNLL